MTKEDLAAQLTGLTYPVRLPRAIEAAAKDAGLVIVFGASDDLLELRGAISEELSAYEGTKILLTRDGVFDEDSCSKKCSHWKKARAQAQQNGQILEALWDTAGYSWMYQISIPHATFEVLEDGEPYCRGVVFALADVEG